MFLDTYLEKLINCSNERSTSLELKMDGEDALIQVTFN